MRTATYETWEEREQLCADANTAGEQMMHDDHLADGTKRLTFDTPRPDWVTYFQDIMPEGEALETTPLDMAAARSHHMDQIRVARDQELAKQDIEYMKASEVNNADEVARIATLKQTLRDIPASFDLSTKTTPDDLMAAWPTELPAR